MMAPPDADFESALRRELTALTDPVGTLSTDPALIIERGRALRTRRRYASVAVFTVCAALAVLISARPWGRSVGETTPTATPSPASTLAYSGEMEGVSWQVYAGLSGAPGSNGQPVPCITMVVSGQVTSPDCVTFWDAAHPFGAKKPPLNNVFEGDMFYGPANGKTDGPFTVMGTLTGHPVRITAVLPSGDVYQYTPVEADGAPFFAVLTPPFTGSLKLFAYDTAGHVLGQITVD